MIAGHQAFFYEFVGKNRIVSLVYHENQYKDKYLGMILIEEPIKKSQYYFDVDEVKINPTYQIKNYPLNKCLRKEYSEYQIKNGILTEKMKYFSSPEDEIPKEETSYYKIGNLSYIWWSYFIFKFERINCPN